MTEVPPTAGLPLKWRELLPGSRSLERELASFVRSPSAQVECSGTAALVVALTALKNSSTRRQVVIPAYTCPLVALAVLQAGLRPIACDTRAGHFDFCPDALRACCNENTLAVIATHLAGRLADMATITAIAKNVDAYVVEDAAQALGALWQGQPAGTVGDIGVYSLGVGKGLTIYGGGALVANAEALREQLQSTSATIVRSQPGNEAKRVLELIGYTALYRPTTLTFAYGIPLRRHLMNDRLIEAVGDNHDHDIPLYRVGHWRKTVGARALQRLSWFLAVTAVQAVRRKSRLQQIPNITVLEDATDDIGTWPCLLVLMPTQQARDKALETLWPAGLGVGRMFIHALPDYEDLAPHFSGADTPNARDFAARSLTISNSHWLRDRDFERICGVLKNAVESSVVKS
ncbi:MAG TPA: DegT/DnrJ/EryC1/StrS family aminotransferase [Methylophilaceae bacterium]